MSIEAWERYTSADLQKTNKDERLSTSWVVRDAPDEGSALDRVLMQAPLAVAIGTAFAVRQSARVKPLGAGLYEATVEYGPEDDEKSEKDPEPLEWKYSFDTTGGKHKLSIAKQEVSRQWARSVSNDAPDLKGAINFDGKKVAGVDVVVPQLEFSITVFYAPNAVTVSFVQELARKTGRTNSDAWLGFQPGEVLFLGARGDGTRPTVRGQRVKPVPVQLMFAASENRDDLIIGDNPATISKKGWEYLWVRYERVENNGLDYPVPVHAYVDRVYDELAFKAFFKFG